MGFGRRFCVDNNSLDVRESRDVFLHAFGVPVFTAEQAKSNPDLVPADLPISLIPINPKDGGKKPLVKWSLPQNRFKYCDPNWEAFAVIPESDIMVLDLDAHSEGEEKDGISKQLNFFADILGEQIRNTLAVSTPSGGLHLYFKVNQDSCFKQNEGLVPRANLRKLQEAHDFLCPEGENTKIDADLRGFLSNGYVLAPGSETENGQYRVVNGKNLAEVSGSRMVLLGRILRESTVLPEISRFFRVTKPGGKGWEKAESEVLPISGFDPFLSDYIERYFNAFFNSNFRGWLREVNYSGALSYLSEDGRQQECKINAERILVESVENLKKELFFASFRRKCISNELEQRGFSTDEIAKYLEEHPDGLADDWDGVTTGGWDDDDFDDLFDDSTDDRIDDLFASSENLDISTKSRGSDVVADATETESDSNDGENSEPDLVAQLEELIEVEKMVESNPDFDYLWDTLDNHDFNCGLYSWLKYFMVESENGRRKGSFREQLEALLEVERNVKADPNYKRPYYNEHYGMRYSSKAKAFLGRGEDLLPKLVAQGKNWDEIIREGNCSYHRGMLTGVDNDLGHLHKGVILPTNEEISTLENVGTSYMFEWDWRSGFRKDNNSVKSAGSDFGESARNPEKSRKTRTSRGSAPRGIPANIKTETEQQTRERIENAKKHSGMSYLAFIKDFAVDANTPLDKRGGMFSPMTVAPVDNLPNGDFHMKDYNCYAKSGRSRCILPQGRLSRNQVRKGDFQRIADLCRKDGVLLPSNRDLVVLYNNLKKNVAVGLVRKTFHAQRAYIFKALACCWSTETIYYVCELFGLNWDSYTRRHMLPRYVADDIRRMWGKWGSEIQHGQCGCLQKTSVENPEILAIMRKSRDDRFIVVDLGKAWIKLCREVGVKSGYVRAPRRKDLNDAFSILEVIVQNLKNWGSNNIILSYGGVRKYVPMTDSRAKRALALLRKAGVLRVSVAQSEHGTSAKYALVEDFISPTLTAMLRQTWKLWKNAKTGAGVNIRFDWRQGAFVDGLTGQVLFELEDKPNYAEYKGFALPKARRNPRHQQIAQNYLKFELEKRINKADGTVAPAVKRYSYDREELAVVSESTTNMYDLTYALRDRYQELLKTTGGKIAGNAVNGGFAVNGGIWETAGIGATAGVGETAENDGIGANAKIGANGKTVENQGKVGVTAVLEPIVALSALSSLTETTRNQEAPLRQVSSTAFAEGSPIFDSFKKNRQLGTVRGLISDPTDHIRSVKLALEEENRRKAMFEADERERARVLALVAEIEEKKKKRRSRRKRNFRAHNGGSKVSQGGTKMTNENSKATNSGGGESNQSIWVTDPDTAVLAYQKKVKPDSNSFWGCDFRRSVNNSSQVSSDTDPTRSTRSGNTPDRSGEHQD